MLVLIEIFVQNSWIFELFLFHLIILSNSSLSIVFGCGGDVEYRLVCESLDLEGWMLRLTQFVHHVVSILCCALRRRITIHLLLLLLLEGWISSDAFVGVELVIFVFKWEWKTQFRFVLRHQSWLHFSIGRTGLIILWWVCWSFTLISYFHIYKFNSN